MRIILVVNFKQMKKTILVCDDDRMLLKTIEHKLKSDGYEVITAQDGEEAIEIFKREKIDLVLTDMHMPYATGLELIDYIRNETGKDTPIIVVTKDSSDETHEDAYEIGADEYLSKPVNPNILSIKVRKMLK